MTIFFFIDYRSLSSILPLYNGTIVGNSILGKFSIKNIEDIRSDILSKMTLPEKIPDDIYSSVEKALKVNRIKL